MPPAAVGHASLYTMNRKQPPILFFTGTDTDVGKTYVASLAAAALAKSGVRVGVYKPVASDCQQHEEGLFCPDADRLWRAAGCPGSIDEVCPQRFLAPLAPPTAAALENRSVDIKLLSDGAAYWLKNSQILIVEGAGGLFSPLAHGFTNADLAHRLHATLVIVAPNRLGVIHQVTATCLAAKQVHGGLPVAGVVLNEPHPDIDDLSRASNAAELRNYSPAPLLGVIPHGGDVSAIAHWLRCAW